MPAPSVNAKASTNTPISRVRGSRQKRRNPGLGSEATGSKESGPNFCTATATVTADAAIMITMCTVTEIPTATAPAPISAPATVPTLYPAWNRGMIARPSRCSTTAPCTFIATSQAPVAKP